MTTKIANLFLSTRAYGVAKASAIGIGLIVMSSSCAETASTGAPVTIPQVLIECATSVCKDTSHNGQRPLITVTFTTSGCGEFITFGSAVSSARDDITCDTQTGCRGQFTSWINDKGAATTTLPSGTYSICARIDFDRDNLAGAPDAVGVIETVSVGSQTGNQILTFRETQ